MSIQDPAAQPMAIKGFMAGYLESLSLVERLHRLLLDVIKDEFERVGSSPTRLMSMNRAMSDGPIRGLLGLAIQQ